MGIKQLKIDVSELRIGMFVSGLDRPWTQTPFPLQGFYIRDLDEIKELKVHCGHVYIDLVKGPPPIQQKLLTLSSRGKHERRLERASNRQRVGNLAPLKVRHNVYAQTVPLEKEISKAEELHKQVYKAVGSVMRQVEAGGEYVPVSETKKFASQMVDSVIRSPDAFTWLARVREKDEYTYSHSVRSAVWAILFGRHIGLPKSDLDVLAMGVLLKDIGKTRLQESVLKKKHRNEAEQKEYEKFVDYGVEILRDLPDVKPRVTSVVKNHCERVNGSGFPNHLRGDKIPFLGKVAGIVTFYDETTNPRGIKQPLSPSRTVAKLYELREVEFQDELVVEFIRAIGLYPTGTLVELSTGEVGVVVEQNFGRRLKPKVVVVMDANKRKLFTPTVVDLAEEEAQTKSLVDMGKIRPGDAEFVEIMRDLEPGAYDIDVDFVREDYIARKKGWSLVSMLKRNVRRFAGAMH